ncbi:MAG: hypothetical protein KDA45_06020 [Planctomycetales bacterium]|nr:hypothetical protein [Planctomycetales bacterium]
MMRPLVLASCVLQVPAASWGQDNRGLVEVAVAPHSFAEDASVRTPTDRSAGIHSPGIESSRIQTPGARAAIGQHATPASHARPLGAQDPSTVPLPLSGPTPETVAQPVAPLRTNALPDEEKSLAPLPSRELAQKISIVDLSVQEIGTGALPESASAQRPTSSPPSLGGYVRLVAPKCVHWQPSNICHFPLYFEDPMLERHGHVRFGCLQPFASGAKFLGSVPLLPYLRLKQPAWEPQYALGQWRPGSCAPLLRDTLP